AAAGAAGGRDVRAGRGSGMSESPSRRLGRILHVRETEARAQCRRTGEAQRRLEDAAARLAELEDWRRHYAAARRQPRDIATAHWHDYQRFLERIDEAIAAQARLVGERRRELEEERQRWLATRQRAESLERVVTRRSAEERREE